MIAGIHNRGNPEQQDVDPILALAKRISASSARFVVLLEHHLAPHMHDLAANETATATVAQSGLPDFCSEMERKVYALCNRVQSPYFKVIFGQHELADLMLAPQYRGAFKLHLTGDYLITAKEVLEDGRKHLKRNPLLVEELYARPVATITETQTPLLHFCHLTNSINAIDQMVENVVMTGLLLAPNFQRRVKDFKGAENLQKAVKDEIEMLGTLWTYHRIYGMCDTNSARNILESTKGRAIINYGFLHGCIANNPASLPEQLVSQAHSRGEDASCEILLLTGNKYSAEQREVIQLITGALRAKVRGSMTVYDVDKKQEWPVQEWLNQKHESHAAPHLPSGPTPT